MQDLLPVTLQSVHCSLSQQENDLVNCVVCPNCDSIYEYDDRLEGGTCRNGPKAIVTMSLIRSIHRASNRTTPCEAMLLKKIKAKRGCFYASKMFHL